MVESLLVGAAAFREERMLVPDLAVAEVVNALYVQDKVLHLIADGRPYVESLFKMIDAEEIEVASCSEKLLLDAYDLASRRGAATYDCIFVALALASGLTLVTRDGRQAGIMKAEEDGKVRGGAKR